MLSFYSHKITCPLLTSFSLWFSSISVAVEDYQLWVPRDYYRFKPALEKAALEAEKQKRCVYVIAGTVNVQKSTRDHPVFTLTCRDIEKKTFAWLMDGLSFEILNLPKQHIDPDQAALEQRRQATENLWQKCKTRLEQITGSMRGLAWAIQGMPDPIDGPDRKLLFSVDFEAASKRGNTMNYTAHCEYEDNSPIITIHPQVATPIPPPLPVELCEGPDSYLEATENCTKIHSDTDDE